MGDEEKEDSKREWRRKSKNTNMGLHVLKNKGVNMGGFS
jgi:hypothetical protein